ncbi:hypothetical protein [Sulfitobacter pacificus]|uniref:hypothetical protein n=1 Tax=Sulfitobacter pacificus TaxID=1499314 RepID=UPI003101D0B8
MTINPPAQLEIDALSAILPYWWAECQDSPTDALLAITEPRDWGRDAGMILWAFWLGKVMGEANNGNGRGV